MFGREGNWDSLLNHLAEYLTLALLPPNTLPTRIDQIEYIRVTGYSVETTEPSFYNAATVALKPQLEDLGIAFLEAKPYLKWANSSCAVVTEGRACRKYAIATKAFWDMWIAIFPNIPLAVTARFPAETSGPNYNYYSPSPADAGAMAASGPLDSRVRGNDGFSHRG